MKTNTFHKPEILIITLTGVLVISFALFYLAHKRISQINDHTLKDSTSSQTSTENHVIYAKEGFSIAYSYALQINHVFAELLQTLPEASKRPLVGAYTCVLNEDNTDEMSIININVYNCTSDIKSESDIDNFMTSYANSCKQNNIKCSDTTYQNLPALVYTFHQDMGTNVSVPTKAIVFINNNKSYLVQLGSLTDYDSKFESLISSISIIKNDSKVIKTSTTKPSNKTRDVKHSLYTQWSNFGDNSLYHYVKTLKSGVRLYRFEQQDIMLEVYVLNGMIILQSSNVMRYEKTAKEYDELNTSIKRHNPLSHSYNVEYSDGEKLIINTYVFDDYNVILRRGNKHIQHLVQATKG